MSLISITVPGDVIGAIEAGFNFGAEQSKAIAAIAADQSPAGLQLKQDLVTLLAPFVAIMAKLDTLLGFKVNAAVPPSPPSPPAVMP